MGDWTFSFPQSSAWSGQRKLAELIGANLHATSDQPFTMLCPMGTRVKGLKIYGYDASGNLALAVGGIYTGPGKGGTPIVAGTQVLSGIGSGLDMTMNSTGVVTLNQLFLAMTTAASGVDAVASFAVFGDVLDS